MRTPPPKLHSSGSDPVTEADRLLARSLYGDLASGSAAAAASLSDAALISRMVDVEAALASAVGATGLVDARTAAATAELISSTEFAVEAIAGESVAGGNPAIPVARRLKAAAQEAGIGVSAVHRGATSQDIIDTALVLCL